jgi:arsenite-transporting ATPase
VPYYSGEVFGLKALSQLALDCFGEEDPGKIFFRGILQEVVEGENGSYLLRIPLPFARGSDVRLRKRGDEMFITIGSFKREMILPTVLARMRAGSGRISKGILEIEFIPIDRAEMSNSST